MTADFNFAKILEDLGLEAEKPEKTKDFKPFEVTVDIAKKKHEAQNILVPLDRYERLIRAEQDAEYLKGLIAEKKKHYGEFNREEIKLLNMIFNESEE